MKEEEPAKSPDLNNIKSQEKPVGDLWAEKDKVVRDRLGKEFNTRYEDFMNNFYSKALPGNYPRQRIVDDPERAKKKYGLLYPGYGSELFQSQNALEFYATIDKVIIELDHDGSLREVIKELSTPPHSWRKREELEPILVAKLVPVFVRLLAMGYSTEELAS